MLPVSEPITSSLIVIGCSGMGKSLTRIVVQPAYNRRDTKRQTRVEFAFHSHLVKAAALLRGHPVTGGPVPRTNLEQRWIRLMVAQIKRYRAAGVEVAAQRRLGLAGDVCRHDYSLVFFFTLW